MTDEKTSPSRLDGHDLRTVTTRLSDLQRKCRSVESRDHEATEMERRIQSVLDRLQPAEDDTDEIPFADLARELYAVERFFESNGFLSVAKEVAHVERTLERMAPADEPVEAIVETPVVEEPVERGDVLEPEHESPDDEEAPSRWSVPRPMAAVMAFFVVAIAICVVIIVRHNAPVERERSAPAPPTPAPTPAPTRRPDPDAQRPPSGPAPGAILAEAVGEARLALAEGDVDLAIDQLSRAALVDADHGTVLGTAQQIVDLLLGRAENAVEGGLWEIADLTLARAGRIAERFGLDALPIDRAAHRYSQMERFNLVQPGDTDGIRSFAGKRVTVILKDGSTRESVIKGVRSGELLLDEDTTVRGGAMYYTEKIPLSEIDYLKVWE
jgi:hypothetical protein